MDSPDYDDPEVEKRWCEEERQRVAEYLCSQGVENTSLRLAGKYAIPGLDRSAACGVR
jgi:hypothetical protein